MTYWTLCISTTATATHIHYVKSNISSPGTPSKEPSNFQPARRSRQIARTALRTLRTYLPTHRSLLPPNPHNGDPRCTQAPRARIRQHIRLAASLHNRSPVRIQHPGVALHLNRATRHTIRGRTILGHPDFPSRLSLRAARNPHAHPLRSLPTLNTPLSQH